MKRLFDIFFSLLAIMVLAIPMAVIAIIIMATDGCPVVFRQERVGLGNKTFKIRKFRSMKVGTKNVATKHLANSDDCITPIGKVLRKTSLDEIPQLINILEGTMSFVGPRPLIPQEEHIRKMREEKNVYSVRPGVTGLAQVNGRDMITDEQKVEWDAEYVQNHNMLMDIKILFKTVAVVFSGKGFAEGGDLNKNKKSRKRKK